MSEHNIISVSGGKDSTALLLLAIERQPENMQAVFADTGHEHDITYDYVKFLNEKVFPIKTVKADFSSVILAKRERLIGWKNGNVDRWSVAWSSDDIDRALEFLMPTGNPFLDLCIIKGRFPSILNRFCTTELKVNPINNEFKNLTESGDDIISWQGIRADESPSRALSTEYEMKKKFPSGGELWNYRPILKWTVEDVFKMHKKHGIEPNPLYKLGQSRVGCFPCIMTTKENLFQIATRFPEQVNKIVEWEKIVSKSSKRNSATFIPDSDRRGDSFDKVIEWAKTGRGGRNYDLFRNEESLPACSSAYGLCE